jgi:hypothetical protein
VKGERFVAAVFSLFGALFLACGGYLYLDTRSFLDGAQAATGTVVEVLRSHSSGSSSESDRYTYTPRVQFTTRDGRMIDFWGNSGNPIVGERVEILYKPDNPHSARLNGFFSLWFGPAFFGGMGALFTSIGGAFTFVVVRRRRK